MAGIIAAVTPHAVLRHLARTAGIECDIGDEVKVRPLPPPPPTPPPSEKKKGC
eukprot:gene7199-34656_t